MMSEAITPFEIRVSDAEIADLKDRLRDTRFPEKETSESWAQGVTLAEAQRLRDHWLNRYDWRRCEASLNAWPNYKTQIDGLGIHFLHIRSPEPDATPLIMTHGYPGSVIEFIKVIGPLTDPVAHGGDAKDAFHLVLPSLPGYGFSDRPSEQGWNTKRIARAWHALMQRLGYTEYVAQGGDWGSVVVNEMGAMAPKGLRAIHATLPLARPNRQERAAATPEEKAVLDKRRAFALDGMGYSAIQRTRPQTLGYGLADSPMAQAAWIYEKFREWTGCEGPPTDRFTMDELLDNISIYWFAQTGCSSARLYWEGELEVFEPIKVPAGFSVFPAEILPSSKRWMERLYPHLFYWGEAAEGGHFAAYEVPDIFIEEVRACFRALA